MTTETKLIHAVGLEMQSAQASDVFPWASIPRSPGLTVAGLISLRHTKERRTWARVLLGTDEELLILMLACVPPDPFVGLPTGTKEAFASYILFDIEGAVSGQYDAMNKPFARGFDAAVNNKGA